MNGRYKNQININNHKKEEIYNIVDSYLNKKKYHIIKQDNFILYQKGGKVRAPQFIQFEFLDNMIKIESWISFTLLPNIFVGEFDFKGYSGLYTRTNIAKDVKYIEHIIKKYNSYE